jgi:hypothetical protein
VPHSDGGCPVRSYSIFMDDGAGGAFAEVDAASVNGVPTLRTHQVRSFAASATSSTFRFKLRATNLIGSADSAEVSYVLAAVPDAPMAGPSLNLAGTSTRRIRVDYAAFAAGTDGGAPVLSYEL